PCLVACSSVPRPRLRAPVANTPGLITSGINHGRRDEIMLPAYPRPHNHSPPQPFFLTDVDQWFNIRLPASLSSINYRHQIGTHYFLRRNPHPASWSILEGYAK